MDCHTTKYQMRKGTANIKMEDIYVGSTAVFVITGEKPMQQVVRPAAQSDIRNRMECRL